MILAALLLLAGDPTATSAEPLTSRDVEFGVQGDARFFPEAAQKAGLDGFGRAVCVIQANGALRDCTVQSAEPAGYGFDGAILKLASPIRIAKTARDGSPTKGRAFRLDMKFKLPR